ncbi:MAG: hypothetical protein B6U69_01195 [Thermofilum sp. ex4484_15]|nr:MAG: hypothetical protein B6U69_01195 [Thermofilum sp. ex4484_15]
MEVKPIALVRASNHYDGVWNSLSLLKDYVVPKLKEAKRILVKPNFVTTRNIYAATHVEAVRAFLDFLVRYVGDRKVIIGEGPAFLDLEDGLRNYGYYELKDRYDIEFVDLNEDDYEVIKVYGPSLKEEIEVRVSKVALSSDLRVSICRPKTHDTVMVTLSIKNLVMGAVQKGDKSKVHQGYKAINLSLAKLAEHLMPHLSIIDGFEGMEGAGPTSGEPIKWGVAVAGTNAVEVDALTAWLMGFDPKEVGYLYYLWRKGLGNIEVDKIRVIGEEPSKLRLKFKPHPTYLQQLNWRI